MRPQQSVEGNYFAMASRDHSLLPKQKAKNEKGIPHPCSSICSRLNKKRSIFLLLGMENVNKPLRCLIRNDADGRHSFFTEGCQCISAGLTRKSTEPMREGRDLTPAGDRQRLKYHPGLLASDHTTFLEVMAWGCLRTHITLSEVLLKTATICSFSPYPQWHYKKMPNHFPRLFRNRRMLVQ